MSITISSLSKSFDEKTIFRDFSYIFHSKGLHLITGKSGGGKTTLLRMIAGLDTNYEGKIDGGGKQNVSLCFQEYRLFDFLSALDNVTKVSFKKATKNDVQNAEKLLISLGFSQNDLLLRPKELSGGMKQRVSLARALLSDKPVILLDEPTKELDDELANEVMRVIKKESENKLVILVTHDIELAKPYADHIISIDDPSIK